MLVSVAKTLIFLPIILIQRADCGSNLPVVPYRRKWFRPLRKGELRTLLSRDAAGKVVVWGGPPAGRACVSDPAARATNRRTPVLTTAKPAQEEPSRVSLRKHRISPALL